MDNLSLLAVTQTGYNTSFLQLAAGVVDLDQLPILLAVDVRMDVPPTGKVIHVLSFRVVCIGMEGSCYAGPHDSNRTDVPCLPKLVKWRSSLPLRSTLILLITVSSTSSVAALVAHNPSSRMG
jgi:hypothetical protein